MSQLQRTRVRYSESFKIRVVEEIEGEGLSISQAQKRYGIKGGDTVQKWIRKFGKFHLLNRIIRIETMEEADRIKQLEEENRKLKLAFADSMLEKRCLQVLIEEVDKAYKTDVKKTFGNSASKG